MGRTNEVNNALARVAWATQIYWSFFQAPRFPSLSVCCGKWLPTFFQSTPDGDDCTHRATRKGKVTNRKVRRRITTWKHYYTGKRFSFSSPTSSRHQVASSLFLMMNGWSGGGDERFEESLDLVEYLHSVYRTYLASLRLSPSLKTFQVQQVYCRCVTGR